MIDFSTLTGLKRSYLSSRQFDGYFWEINFAQVGTTTYARVWAPREHNMAKAKAIVDQCMNSD